MSRSPTERLLLTADGLLDARGRAWPDVAAWCAAHAGARVELLLGAGLAHSLLVPADLPLADEAALLRYARLQFVHYFGPVAQAWPLAAWDGGACALAEGNLTDWQAAATAHGVRITSLRPSWTLAPAQDGDAAVIDGPMLTWLRRRDGRLFELQQRHVDDELLAELAGAHLLQAADLLAAPAARTGPDFITPPSRMRPLLWAWAATAAAACVLLALQVQGQRDEARRLAEQSTLLDRIAQPKVAAKPPDAAARGRAWAVARELGTDWGTLWADVERALPPGLQIAALDLDRQALRLEGQASDADTVTRLVDRLTLHAAPGDQVVLTRLQKPETPGEGALRFELVRRQGAAP